MRDLNFVLRSEIFVHSDGKLRVSHLILGIDLVYTTWQNFSQALLVDRPLLLYIDVRHANLLPPSLMVGEARDLGLWYTTADSLAPIRDALVDLVSQSCRVHIPVEELEALIQVAELVAAESINFSDNNDH